MWRRGAWAALIITAAGLVGLVWFFLKEGRSRSDEWASVFALLLSYLVTAVSVMAWIIRRGGVRSQRLPELGGGQPQQSRPIAEWKARDLGVHEWVTDGAADSDDEPPYYVVRRHDHEIRALLRDAATRNLMLVLVGGSAAGKTRAAYEAVRELPHVRSWPILRPAGTRQLLEVLARGVSARSVLWLDDAHRRFLNQTNSSKLAEGLINTLSRPGPMLIVADMWTSHWNNLEHDAPADGSEWRSNIRALLGLPQVQMIKIAESFADASEGERVELERCADRDPRLALAVRTAGPGLEITQVLSGGPQLLRHYNDAHYAPHAHAIITAAMDARRLGWESPVTAEILRRAAEGYLDDRQRVTDSDWFAMALTDATRQHRGIAALTPTRHSSGLGPADGYVLHDFLDHHARDFRARLRPPGSLWNALADHPGSIDDLTRVAAEAQRRGLYRLAARFAVPAAESGSVDAMRLVAGQLELRGATAEAREWRQRIDNLNGPGLSKETLALFFRGPSEKELRARAEAGDRDAMRQLADRLLATHAEQAVTWARRAADTGDSDAVMFLAEALESAGRENEAEKLLHERAKAGHPEAMWRLVLLLEGQGRDEEAFVWIQRHAEAGDPIGLARLLVVLQQRGREREAEALLRSRVQDDDDSYAMWYLADWLAKRNQTEEAVGWFQRSAERSLLAVKLLVDRLEQLGHLEDAEAPLRIQAQQGEAVAIEKLADLLERLGRGEEAGSLLRTLMESAPWRGLPHTTEPSTMRRLIDLLERAGRAAEAGQVRMYGIEPGGTTAAPWDWPRTSP